MKFIQNIGDYYSQHFFADDFQRKVFDKAGYVTQKKADDATAADNHISVLNSRILPLREKYYRFKNDLLQLKREKDKVKRTHDFHGELLHALGYANGTPTYSQPVYLNEKGCVPVRLSYSKGGKPYLFVMEMKAIVNEGDKETDGIYEQVWTRADWELVFPATWGEVSFHPDVVRDALSELFLLPEDERPVYVLLLAGAKIFLIHFEKWKYDSFLLFDLEELFVEARTDKDFPALFYALLTKSNFLSSTDSLLQTLDEDAHKAAYGVTQNLKNAVIFAVESLANEAIWYKKHQAKTLEAKDAIEQQMADERFARELKDECLSLVYRLLFLFYAEAREDLEILPVKDKTYQKGYSLEMLRDLEMIALTTESSRNGDFISQSLWKLFDYLHKGVKTENGFSMKPLDSPLFDNKELRLLTGVQFRNVVLQEIIKRLSVSKGVRGQRPGRISYANLGINQLGSVYESLLAFNGFFATETLIEVKKADDPDGKEGTFLVPLSRRDEFSETEILKDPENPLFDKQIPKGQFVYRLNGRDRKKSASFYTPEVLTQTTVKYTLKGIIDKLKTNQEAGEDCANELLKLKILEPAMGAAAFQNEVINQLAVMYLELKETEEVRRGRKRIVPGNYTDELQKVKAYIAANNVYGVDLNPTAVELGKLSLWLNCMHRNMETPFFAHRLGVGNAVVGCWLKVYDQKDVNVEYPAGTSPGKNAKPVAKAWWTKAPKRINWLKDGSLNRKPHQYYHFLLPDENMLASAGIGLIKSEFSEAQKKAVAEWKAEMKKPLNADECKKLEKICKVIDTLLVEHSKQIQGIIKDTTSIYKVYGMDEQQTALKGYDEKEHLTRSLNARNSPFYKLRTVMDYWCSLWFWDARQVVDLPTRDQWYNEVENILGVDLRHLDENADARAILENIWQNAGDRSLLFSTADRLQVVEALREQHRFFHHELEFLEVFKERGGFDVVVGNPPWLKLQFEEKDIIAELFPEVSIRKTTAPQVRKLQESYLAVPSQKAAYFAENIGIESSALFMNAVQNYPLLKGQQTNLYKCVLENGFSLTAPQGFMGLLHPEGVYDDPNGQPLRKEMYKRLKYHFQFINEQMLFSEVHHSTKFSTNVYSGTKSQVDFKSINNLFHPATIDGCFNHDGKGISGGYKIIDEKSGKMIWNSLPHNDRIVHITDKVLNVLAKTFEDSKNGETAKLVSIHTESIVNVLVKLSDFNTSIKDFETRISVCLDETNDVNNGTIKRKTQFPNIEKYEMIYSGPHFFVSNPVYKTPTESCVLNSDYNVIELNQINEEFVARTNYVPNKNPLSFPNLIKGFQTGIKTNDGNIVFDNWIDYYKVGYRKMVGAASERTLTGAILPPNTTHVNGVISIIFKNTNLLIETVGLTSSLVMDFYLKTTGKSNVYDVTIKTFPLGISPKYKPQLFIRTLMLNCLNKYYAPLWEESWQEAYKHDSWSKADSRLKPFDTLTPEWQWSSPLRNWYERRWALVEIDVITAMALGLTLDELILIYNVQFPVLQQNEDDTWYDQRGNIIFTCSKGLNGVGIDRPEWEKLCQEVNPLQRTLKSGDTYTHTITKSELYQGQQVTYYAPFDKCDRVEDYRRAWEWFDGVFGRKI
jgi:hypothetical protein